MKKILIIIGIVVGVIVGIGGAFIAFKNPLIKSAFTTGATQLLGVSVQMDDFSLSLLKQSVRIKGFRVYNPEGFPKDEVILDIPEVSVDCDVNSLIGGKLHLPYIALNMKEVSVIRNRDGKLNVDVIREALGQGEPSGEEEPPEETEAPTEGEPSEAMEMQIDRMTLSVGKVYYKDYSKGDKPRVMTLDVGIKERTYTDITSAQDFGKIVLSEILGHKIVKTALIEGVKSAIGGVEGLPSNVKDVTDIAGNMLLGKEGAGVEGKPSRVKDITGFAENILSGKDGGGGVDFNVGYTRAFKVSIKTLQEMGKVTKADKDDGVIKGKVDGNTVTIEISKKAEKQVRIKVEAKKLIIPQPKLTKKILAKITDELK